MGAGEERLKQWCVDQPEIAPAFLGEVVRVVEQRDGDHWGISGFAMWLLEHLPSDRWALVLREAYRVLRPGGSVALTETDYTTFKVLPESADWEYLAAAQHDYFEAHGYELIKKYESFDTVNRYFKRKDP